MSKNVVDMTLRANMDLSQVSSGLNQMQGILKQLKLSPTLKKEFDSLFSTAATDLEKYQAKLQSGFKTKGDITGFEKVAQGLEKSLDKIGIAWSKLQEKDLSKLVKLDSSAIEQIQQIDNNFKELEKTLKGNTTNSLKTIVEQINSLSTKTSKQAGLGVAEALGAGEYKEALALVDEYISKLERMGAETRGGKYADNLQIFQQMREGIVGVISETDKYNQKVNELKTDKLTIMADAVDKTGQKLQQGSAILSGVTQKTHEYSKATQESATKTVELGNDLDMLKNRVQYFFSLTNSVMLFRRILQDTIQTTKELDAAMTETAVVTDFSVADMWKDLPKYTEAAKELGTTIQGVYETTTLYYQQGLKTNEVFEVGTETLKMAKIAGLDYAQATDFMTAALRGFNMEVNELNAQKVNDVYSELAAITAADTQEIATAMTKTASIASSANMEFETTAAFLSQIIETTRESAETAGTAMKTVIARFTELKKDPAEIGEVDGEIVDANKIETALRTIDVALRDTNGQFRDLDEVFLDIAEKWEGLDTNTQRYIATMAAGSRQQSRFIAMMSDYDRTMQLVSAANNSAGASQKQFDKTLESLESKLNQLETAWHEFTMGIANNTLIKAGVDAITGLLNIINKLTEHLLGATKGIANLLLMIGGFTAGGKIFRAFSASVIADLNGLSKGAIKAGEHVGDSFITALSKEFKTTKKIFSLENLIGTIPQAEIKDFSDRLNKSILNSNKELEVRKGQAARFAASGRDTSEFDKNTEKLQKQYEALTKTQQAYDKASMTQKSAYLALLDAQVPKDMALLALQKELTEEDYRELAIKSLLATTKKAETELTEEEIKARQQAIISKQAEYSADKMGLLTKAKYIALLLFGNKNTREEAATKLAAAGATWAQKAAQDGLNASMFAFPIGWILAGIAALTIALVALAKWSKTQTLEYKMEKAAEATEKAKETAEQAKQAYDDLNSSIEEIGTKEEELENLTYGTLEWQRALLEVNQQVMDLIDKFPEMREQLLNELQVSAEGKLTLTTKGYEMMQEKALNQYKNALAGQIVSSGNEAYLQKQQALSNYNNYNALVYKLDDQGQTQEASFGQKMAGAQMFNSATQNTQTLDIVGLVDLFSGNTEAITERTEQQLEQQQKGLQLYSSDKEMTILSSEQKDAIYEEFLENSRMFESNTPALQEFAKGMGIASESLLEFVPAMRERQQAEVEYGLAMQAQAKQLLLSTTSDNFKNKDNSRELADTFGQFYAEQQEDLIAEEAKKITDVGAYAKEMGLSGFIDQGSELKNLQKVYQELTGSTKEQVEEMFGESKQELKKAIAAIKVGKDWGQKVEGFAADLEEFGKDLIDEDIKNKINNLFGGADGTGFGFGELGDFKTKEGTKIDAGSEEAVALEELYNSSSALQDQFETFAEFLEWRNKQNEKGWELEQNVTKDLTAYGLMGQTEKGATNVSFTKGLDLGAVSGLSQKIVDVFSISGREAAVGLSDNIKTITDSLSPEKADLFASALNGIDWNNKEEVKGFSEVIEDLGIYIDPAVGDVDDLEQEIISLAKASTKVSLENLTESIQNLSSIALQIKNGEIEGRSFSQEMVDTLVSSGTLEAKDFSFNIETGEYTYLGESTAEIVAAIQQQTVDLLNGDNYDQLIDSGEAVKQLKETGNYDSIGTTDYAKMVEFIKAYNEKTGAYDDAYLDKLLSGTADATIQKKISEVYDSLISDYLNLESNYKARDDAERQNGVTVAQTTKSASEIATDLSKARDAEGQLTGEEAKQNAQDIEILSTALRNQAEAAGVSKSKIDEYAGVLAKINDPAKRGEESLDDLKKQATQLEKELSNAIGFNKTNKALEETISGVIDLLDEYENLEDQTSQVEQVQKMVDAFDLDLDVDTSNYQDIYDYMLGIAQGSYEAYQGLMNLAMGEFGVTITGEGKFDGLNSAIDFSNQKFIDFINNMIQNGAFVEETVSQEDVMNYVGYLQKVVDDEGNITYEPITKETVVTSDITVVRPKAAGEIQTVSNQGGGGSSYTPSGGGGGGGGGSDSGSEEEPWENTFDKFYNINEDINELLDKRNKLETDYDLLLHDENATIDDYLKSYTDRIKSFKEEIALQEEMLRLRKQEQEELLSDNSHLSEYAWVEDGAVYIDYEAIDRVEDQELGEEIEEFVSALEENDEAIQEANDAISENTLAIEDLLDEWRNETADFEQKVFDAIVEQREKEIEKMEEASEALENSNSELVSAIQKEIDERRQQRENKETEENLAEKERRLAYLQQDTSGAYDTEILQLEKDLKQQKEDYTDTLIDQRIADLEQQNDEAAKQREKQIQIAQYQLKNEQDTGIIAQQVSQMLKEATSTAGWNKVWSLLEKSAGFKGLTETNKLVWVEDTRREFQKAMAYLKGSDGIKTDLENISIAVGGYASSIQDNINDVLVQSQGSYSGNLGDEGTETVTYGDPVKVDKTAIDYRGKNYYQVGGKWYDANQTNGFDSDKKTTQIAKGANPINNILMKDEVLLSDVGVGFGNTKNAALASIKNNGWNSEKLFGEEFISYNGYYYKYSDVKTRQVTSAKDKNGNVQKGYQAYLPLKSQSYKKYKTGGLADYTGPAWLDGTKSRPELVLNQKDTQNFLQLKDVLGAFMKQNKVINNSTSVGDTVYDISISVEKMTSDYDVEQVATKIKQMISSDAAYRNSTMVQRLR